MLFTKPLRASCRPITTLRIVPSVAPHSSHRQRETPAAVGCGHPAIRPAGKHELRRESGKAPLLQKLYFEPARDEDCLQNCGATSAAVLLAPGLVVNTASASL